jgi:hypothetical protein
MVLLHFFHSSFWNFEFYFYGERKIIFFISGWKLLALFLSFFHLYLQQHYWSRFFSYLKVYTQEKKIKDTFILFFCVENKLWSDVDDVRVYCCCGMLWLSIWHFSTWVASLEKIVKLHTQSWAWDLFRECEFVS